MSNESTISNDLSSPLNPELINVEELKLGGKTFRENAGASIIDIGDRIGLIEFHTKANALNDDISEMIMVACNEGSSRFDALVVGNRGKHFSAGANLALVLAAARAGKWADLEHTIRSLQNANMTLKYGPLPVVAAPFSNALGGGCEVCLHSAKVVAAEETHMGLVETGVGLIPAGGGTKELGLRAQDLAVKKGLTEPLLTLTTVLENITHARVSQSGLDAKQLFLKEADTVVNAQGPPIEIAKQVAIGLVHDQYRNGTARSDIPLIGTKGISAFQSKIDEIHQAKLISDHDAVIAVHVATILCGGNQPAGTATEQHFLDLEREAFLSLLGTEKTQERIEFLLTNNKLLRN
ncbi:enoyl-CoA hydratase/isomerase family protein [Mucilaginibacter sp. McL0603]|uniref:enoyl-CoA hydratase/isomerase family protein n=1 Tax=Mucilaginibacter sp. McL0603 TaxID=3415670 RepID=UPI003CF245B0